MIQAVNFSNNNYSTKTNTNPSFAQKAEPGFVDYRADEFEKPKKKSKAARFFGYIGMQFAAGAIVSGIFDGLTNDFRAIKKNHPPIPLKDMGTRAAFTGAAFAVIGLVFNGIAAAFSKKNKD